MDVKGFGSLRLFDVRCVSGRIYGVNGSFSSPLRPSSVDELEFW